MTTDHIKLVLLSDDPIFGLGLSSALAPVEDLQVVGQGEMKNALVVLKQKLASVEVNLVVLASDNTVSVLDICQQFKQNYPQIRIVLLATSLDSSQIATARQLGIDGYCHRGIAVADLAVALRQVAKGKIYWQERSKITSNQTSTIGRKSSSRVISTWLQKQQISGLAQIESNLQLVRQKLQISQSNWWDILFWQGRKRELLTAYWLVAGLARREPNLELRVNSSEFRSQSSISSQKTPVIIKKTPTTITNTASPIASTLIKIQSGLENLTQVPLEIDILQPERKQELLHLVLQQWRKIIEELGLLQVTIEDLPERKSLILRDLWQASTIEFLGRYYRLPLESGHSQMVENLMQDAVSVQRNNLDQIPFVVELCAYVLYDQPLVINNIPYRHNAPEADAQAEIILQNLVIQVANGVMQLFLNRFPEEEALKYSLYNSDFLSSRSIAQFRNNLSWRTRNQEWFKEPQAVFESKYYLYVFSGNGIRKVSLYAPRQQELQQLEGIPWLVTIVLETRDAIAPRLRNVISFIGGGVVYFLTQVIGKGIGLIGRGIIQGIGNTLQK